MNTDTMTGAANEVGGRVKEAAGALSGSASLKAEGLYDQAVGGTQRAFGEAKDVAQETGRAVSRKVEQQPLPAILTAGLIGFVVGFLIAR
ncbi:CsbD family protein [Azorhizobium sp. AG788]|uniref:CsbD family protein n=1 Tax=Azorhizobium sp. AG788 TaxID=2183897 RepID=UPI0031393F75